MTQRVVSKAKVVREMSTEQGAVRALRAERRGHPRLLLEVSFRGLARFLAPDDDRQLYRCTEFQTEAELLEVFDRVAASLAR